MSSMGYEVYEKNDVVYIKRDGAVQVKINFAEISDRFRRVSVDDKRRRQLCSYAAEIPGCKLRPPGTTGCG